MRKILLITLLVSTIGTVAAFADNMQKVAGISQYTVTAAFPDTPLKVGENPITVVVRDIAGNTVTDSGVTVQYDMPGMDHNLKERIPGGLISRDLTLTGGSYKGTLNFTMPGQWVVDVKTVRSGRSYTASYTVNVVR